MTDTTTSITVDDLVGIEAKNKDSWNAFNKMQSLTKSAPEGTLSRLLWQAVREDRMDMSKYNNAWWRMATVTDAYDAELFVKFFLSIYEDDQGKPYPSWSADGDLPGWNSNLDRFLDANKENPAFGQGLANLWKDIPAPHGTSLGVKLAALGFIAVTDLPEGLLDELAALALRQSRQQWSRNLPWSDDVWYRASIKAGLTDEVDYIANPKFFTQLASYATAEEVTILANKVGQTTDQNLPSIEAIGAHGEAIIPSLEEALRQRSDFALGAYNEPCGSFYLVLGYCRACQIAGHTPPEELDGKIQKFVSAYKPGWSGGSFDDYHTKARQYLTVIPVERLSKIFANADKISWLLVGAAPTEEVCRRVAQGLAIMGKDPFYDFDKYREIALTNLGQAVVPALCDALNDGAGSQRESMVQALGKHADPRAIPILVEYLGDKAKGIREAAKSALLAMSTEEVLEELEEALGARRKDARLAGAEVLRALPPTQAGYEMAQKYLDGEKTADVVDVLSAVVQPVGQDESSDLDVELYEKILQDLHDQAGAWEKYSENGREVMAAFVEFLSQNHHGQSVYLTGAAREGLLGILERFSDEAEVRRAYANILGAFSDSMRKVALNMAAERVPDIVIDLAEAFAQGRITRPASFGPAPRYGRTIEAVDVLEWLLKNHPEHAWEAAVVGLQDDKKAVRDLCVSYVTQFPDKLDVDEVVAPLLTSRTKDTRQVAVEILAELADPAHLPLLEEALKKERAKAVKKLIDETIIRINVAGMDVSRFADDEKGNAELDERLCQLPAVDLNSSVQEALADLPTLHWKSGAALSKGAARWFIAEVLAESGVHHGEKVRQVRQRLVDQDCYDLCDALIEIAGRDDLGWGLFIQSIIASPKQIESLGSRLEKFASSQNYGWSDYAIEVLVRVGTGQAARIMDDWAQRTRKKALRSRARSGVRRIAQGRGISIEELIEASMGTLGFEEDGAQTFDYGSRKITVRLLADGALAIEDDEGTRLKSMPQARKADDDALAKAARARVSQIKKDIKRIRRTQTRRLEGAMVSGRRWVPSVWRQRFADHPLMRSLSFGLVWGIYDGDDKLLRAFQLDDDGQPVDLEFEAPTFDDEKERIGLAHPLHLGEARAAWLEALADYERVQPFKQLERPIYEKEGAVDLNTYLAKVEPVEPSTFLGRLNRLGYELGPRQDAGLIFDSTRHVDDMLIVLSHTGLTPESMDWMDQAEVSGISIQRGKEFIDLDKVSPLIYSEVMHDIHALMEK